MKRQFRGKAGTIYVEAPDAITRDDYEVWFEDFCILGTGPTEVAALEDAAQHSANITTLIRHALVETRTTGD